MGKHCQVVMGPAGVGKSTYCHIMQQHCQAKGRTLHVINLDPAADRFAYQCSADVRDLITLEDVMEEKTLGPNGGLIFCMEYLLDNIEWLADTLGDFPDDYILFDCPGQIELFTHVNVVPRICQHLQQEGYRVAAVYLMDSTVCFDLSKFISGTLASLATMIHLEMTHFNVLTKCDKLSTKFKDNQLDDYLACEFDAVSQVGLGHLPHRFKDLATAIATVIHEFNVVSFLPLDVSDPHTIEYLLSSIDMAIQYGEDLEPPEPKDLDEPDDD
jgi:GTPase SAR1 family protein